jgi:hypothetical protein
MKYGVCAPVGGYGNHLRWLILLSKEFTFLGVTDKINFLKGRIYPPGRTGYGWISKEYEYRTQLNGVINFSHHLMDIADPTTPNKIVALTIKPKYALRAYAKFNPNINDQSIRSCIFNIARLP